MKLTQEYGSADAYRIRGYDSGRFHINEQTVDTSVLVAVESIDPTWPPTRFEELTPEHLEPVLALDPEIVLLGTGPEQHFPSREFMRVLLEKGIGLEVMDTASACRTYNVLMVEGRRVVAALLP